MFFKKQTLWGGHNDLGGKPPQGKYNYAGTQVTPENILS